MERTSKSNPPFRSAALRNARPRQGSSGQHHREESPRQPESHSKQQIVSGLRPVIEALDSEVHIDRILIQNGLSGNLVSELKSKLRDKGVPFQYVPAEKLDRLTQSNHQGVVATISPIKYHSFQDILLSLQEQGRVPFIILLDQVTDVRNMGAIVRTIECAGADAVVVPEHGSARISEDAIKTSSGALLRVPVCREQNLKTVVRLAQQCGLQVVAATEKASQSYLTVDFTLPTLLLMGSEEKGISPELLKLCDVRASLPIRGEVQSLNVSVAAAVFMYEALRQRQES